jgi:hypothetical protein
MGQICSTQCVQYIDTNFTLKSEENNAVGRPNHRLEDSITTDVISMGCEDMTGFMWLRIDISGEIL